MASRQMKGYLLSLPDLPSIGIEASRVPNFSSTAVPISFLERPGRLEPQALRTPRPSYSRLGNLLRLGATQAAAETLYFAVTYLNLLLASATPGAI